MDATMEEKQQYLRVNILEAGYDAQEFIEFLHENTSEGSSPSTQTPPTSMISPSRKFRASSRCTANIGLQPTHHPVRRPRQPTALHPRITVRLHSSWAATRCRR